ncbi:Sugar kinase of the NBD/HSP70 family, may contain an N-terminal HTH domain [Micrococcales bacterium KH10]|nr:Sugar kinase of the NBD/HSP70 family, may contain an N-terminal HTH domain [Micrococcales bacterium KH10]
MNTNDNRPPLRIGLDIGGTKVLGVLIGPSGRVIAEAREATIHGPEGTVKCAVNAIDKLLSDAGPRASIAGIGVGIPGLVDPLTGVVSHAVNLEITEPFDLHTALRDRLTHVPQADPGPLPIIIDNDLNVAALGAGFLRGETDTDLAFVAVGTGLAAGIVLDGRLRRGAWGAAGEIGHVPMDPAGPLCPCGQRGCLELYASGSALERQWGERSVRPAPRDVFDAAAAGDVRATRIRDEFAAALAWAVRLLVLTYDVKNVVLGGGVSSLGEPLLQAVREQCDMACARSQFLTALGISDRIALSPMGVPVAAIGAAVAGGAASVETTLHSSTGPIEVNI